MTTQQFRPEVEERLRQLDPSVHQADAVPIDKAIADYMAHGERDPWTVEVARRIFEEDAEFFRMLGDR